jgi:hypothetical protein
LTEDDRFTGSAGLGIAVCGSSARDRTFMNNSGLALKERLISNAELNVTEVAEIYVIAAYLRVLYRHMPGRRDTATPEGQ